MRTELIEKKIADIIEAINLVSDNLPEAYADFEKSGLVKHGLYKQLEHAIESVLDICSMINSDLNLGMPETEDNILDNLERKKVFSVSLIQLIREMKKFRNILVHKYGNIDDKKAYNEIKEGLKDFELIINEIERFLKAHLTKKK